MRNLFVKTVCAGILAANAGFCAAQPDQPAATVAQENGGVVMHRGSETLHLSVCGPGLLHIVAGPGDPKSASPDEPWLLHSCTPDHFDFSQDASFATLRTAQLQVTIALASGELTFANEAGGQLLAESDRRTRVYSFTLLE